MNRLKFSLLLVFSFSWVLLALLYSKSLHLNKDKAKIGENAVLALYNFGTVEQLNQQMKDLKSICSEGVFNQLTIDNEDRTLNTYLKFKNKATEVNIIKSTESYVLYTLNNDYISADRKFVFLFEINQNGVIDWVREEEAIDFINYD